MPVIQNNTPINLNREIFSLRNIAANINAKIGEEVVPINARLIAEV